MDVKRFYHIRYCTERQGACVDIQEAHNAIAAMEQHKREHPAGFARQYKRHSDGAWVTFE